MKHHSSFFLFFSFFFFSCSISAQNYTIILSVHKHAITPFSVFGCWLFKERAPRWTFNIAPPNKLILNSFSFTISSRVPAFIGMASTLLYAVFSNTTKCGINLPAWIASVILFSSLLGGSGYCAYQSGSGFAVLLSVAVKCRYLFCVPQHSKYKTADEQRKKKTQGPRELGSAALTPAGHDKEGERRELEREGQSSCFLRHAKLTSGGRSLQQNPEKLSEGWLCNSVRFHPKKMIPPPSQRHQRGEQKDAKREANVFFPVYLFSSFLPDTFPVVSSLDNVASETTQSSFLVERESWISVC